MVCSLHLYSIEGLIRNGLRDASECLYSSVMREPDGKSLFCFFFQKLSLQKLFCYLADRTDFSYFIKKKKSAAVSLTTLLFKYLQAFDGPASDSDVCTYHAGVPIFHEGFVSHFSLLL